MEEPGLGEVGTALETPVPDGVNTVPVVTLGTVMFAIEAVPVYSLLAVMVPAVPLDIDRVEFASGNGGNDEDSGDDDDVEMGFLVVPLAAEKSVVEFVTGKGGDSEADG